MSKKIQQLIVLISVLSTVMPLSAFALPSVPTTITILHTNDFHGQLEASGSNPGIARVAAAVNNLRAAVGSNKVLLVDAGDSMQGSLLSNVQKGVPAVHAFNAMGYNLATVGNHDFDWGQQVLSDRTAQATHPFVVANVVVNDTGNCTTAGWTTPAFIDGGPYRVLTVGTAPNQVRVALIGVTTTETPYITLASATAGLCFKDPFGSILHYYDEMKAQADVVVVLSHLGYTDGGYGYGLSVYGDQTLAQRLNTAGKPVNLIIGGHSHTNLASATVVGNTSVAQAYYNGRNLGQADVTVNPSGTVAVSWQRISISTSGTADPTLAALVSSYVNDPAYQQLINQEIGWTNVPIARDYNGDSLMGYFVNDAIYNDLNSDGTPANDVDMVFNNAGGIRADITCTAYPCKLTYGSMFNVLPFGNQTVVGDMTGVQVLDLINQSATLFKGALQPAGMRYKFYRYSDALPGPQPYAWGGYDICVNNRSNGQCEPLDLTRTYRVGTNEFLAPAGQDGFVQFKYMTNITYWGDMLNGVNRWVSATYTQTNPYNEALDGRITRDGTDTGGSIVPVTILHHNDSHGNLVKGSYVGYTQLAAKIKQERAHNPNRTLLLNAGDSFQGDAMMYYFKSAALGYSADGTPLGPTLQINPLMAAFNSMNYDAMTLGNHEFNFGKGIFASSLAKADFPILQANISDDGQYGLAQVPILPYIEKTVGPEGIKVAILGIGNHRVPNYELPSNIPGLTFADPVAKAQELSDALRSNNDVVLALTHIGFTENPDSVEVDTRVDTAVAANVTGLDAVIGGHSHTDPSKSFGAFKFLPTFVGGPNNTPVLINHAYRYNNTLGEVVLGMRPDGNGGYEVASRAGRYIQVSISDPEDPDLVALAQPYVTLLAAYNNTVVGQTTLPIDALQAFTQETNGANLQADASVYELERNRIPVDFHLAGAMTNRAIAGTGPYPVALRVSDMFTLMPYENSLVVLEMNGPQIKQILERAYRNYFYYKYVPGYGGYSYYTTCMLDINSGGQITYNDLYPALPNGYNVFSLTVNGTEVDFHDASTYYRVSTVNYLAAGSCNFNDGGVSLWPLDRILNDTQYYVRDAVVNYVRANSPVSPAVEGRISHVAVPGPVGTLGTQIMLTGPGFGNKKGKVLIGGIAAKIISWDDSSILCEIKKVLPTGPYDIVVIPKEPKGADPITMRVPFTMTAPEILFVDPNSGVSGDERVISGNNFGSKKGKVFLGNKSCKVLSWTMDAATGESDITFIVPKKMASGTYDVTVTGKAGSATLVGGFTIP
jgi:2',3'-cyclic-nucleotide 2'-phosphodiesterase (5'-nucleotidase family)